MQIQINQLINDGLLAWVLGQLLPYVAALITKSDFSGSIKAIIVSILAVIAAIIQAYSTKQFSQINIETIGAIFIAILTFSQQHYLMFTKAIKSVEQKVSLW